MAKLKFEVKGLDPGQLNPHGYGGMCSRETVVIQKATDPEKYDFESGIDTIATTEQPAIIADWDRWEYVREVLPMRYAEMPDNDETSLLDTHSRISIDKVLGSARNWSTAVTQLLTKVFVSSTEDKLRKKIQEGHIKNVSLGYETDPDYTVEIPKGAVVTIDGVEYRNDFNDGLAFLVRTWFKLKELSLVPIGADNLAKFKQEKESGKFPKTIINDFNESMITLFRNEIQKSFTSINKKGDIIMENELTVEQLAELEVTRRMDINDLAKTFGKNYKLGEAKLKEAIDKAIGEKWSVEHFKAHLFDNYDSTKSVEQPETHLDLTKKQMKDYSMMDGINSILAGQWGKGKSQFVKECSDEIATRLTKLGVTQHDNSFFVPNEYWGKSLPPSKEFGMMFRAMDVGISGSGGINLVGTDYRGDLFIELLRSKLALGKPVYQC